MASGFRPRTVRLAPVGEVGGVPVRRDTHICDQVRCVCQADDIHQINLPELPGSDEVPFVHAVLAVRVRGGARESER
ncbi:hypothetical protein D3C85_1729690 [compost metagenome]